MWPDTTMACRSVSEDTDMSGQPDAKLKGEPALFIE